MTPYDYVNPMIGTSGHGHTFPGATRPFGMVQLSPDTYTKGWDWCSGYHYSDSSIMGFSHTHLSGTGRGDLLDILLMPTTGKLQTEPGSRENPDEGYRSRFSHSDEQASPGYYSVLLKDYSIQAELTSTVHAGFHRYTFPETKEAHIIIDLFHGYEGDSVTETSITIVNDSLITGSRKSRGWGLGEEKYWAVQEVYFAAKFSKPFSSSGIVEEGEMLQGTTSVTGRNLKAFVNFSTRAGEKVLVKIGISAVDPDGAMNNLDKEVTDWDFDRIRNEAKQEWEAQLGKISVEDAAEDVKTIFYTALYHSMIAPYQSSDVDGRYTGFDKKVHNTNGSTNYTVFSLWDTFRAENPLNTLIQQDRLPAMVQSFLNQYNEYGLLPVWPLWGSETNCMIGYHAVPVIADAYLKGIPGIDIEKLYPAMKKSAMQDDFGIEYLKEYGYIPFNKDDKSVSKTLEYAFDDWCLAQVANKLGKEEDFRYFMKRSQAYTQLFDPEYKLMNGKSTDGKARRPFDPIFSSFGPSDFIEGNSWQYSFFVPHDIPGLVKLYGGEKAFGRKLQDLFTLQPSNSETKPPDVSGLIGEYAHGNEPSHHVAYLFNFANQPDKTQYWLKKIMTTLYDDTPDGLCGNEDCGQMSAWYVFSALGFYPVNPASGEYELGTPMVKKAVLNAGKNPFVIEAKDLTEKNIYVQDVILNGKILDRHFITHKEILEGGTLVFTMGKNPVVK
jgi:predicted alpha-1,2-mannosidase